MKKALSIIVLVLLVAGASFVVYASNVSNTKHNMTQYFGTGGTTEVCVFCHTPHDAQIAIPLWNHDVPSGPYQIYNTSATLDGATRQPQGVSLACLGCHDGTIAIDALGNNPPDWSATGSWWANTFEANGQLLTTVVTNLGTDLSDDHPISITYDVSDTDLNAIVNGKVGTLQLFALGGDFTVECGSCHAVHDDTYAPFLRMTNAASALCVTCHSK